MKVTFKSIISYNGGSFKTVVPMSLVKLLNFENGDELTWNVDIKEKDAIITLTKTPKKE